MEDFVVNWYGKWNYPYDLDHFGFTNANTWERGKIIPYFYDKDKIVSLVSKRLKYKYYKGE